MDTERDLAHVDPFMPLSPTPRGRLSRRFALVPLLWLAAIITVAITVHRTDAIAFGILIATVAAGVAAALLALLRAGRERERARYADRR